MRPAKIAFSSDLAEDGLVSYVCGYGGTGGTCAVNDGLVLRCSFCREANSLWSDI